MKSNRAKILTHAGCVVLLLAVACIYFAPILKGKVLPQGDVVKYECMAHAQKQYHAQTGDYSNWCPTMFSGMPGYQITSSPQPSVFTPVKQLLNLSFMGWENTIGVMFLYLLGFYVALTALGASWWLALLGALAFGLGSYNIIIIEAGHITKAAALAMAMPILAGMLLSLRGAALWSADRRRARGRILWGTVLFLAAIGLQISYNHIQITFYTAIAGICMGVAYLIYALVKRHLMPTVVTLSLLVVAALLAVACNARHLLVNQEYVKHTMRGGTELTVMPPYAGSAQAKTSEGLNIDYAYSWSYGVDETYTLLVPGAKGGGSNEPVDNKSELSRMFRSDRLPLYWGDQPFTSGPVYFGAIVIFLFLFSLLVTRGPDRWWVLAAVLFTVMLSWGRNFMPFNEWIFHHMPLYNKFRTPSMALVVPNVLMVFMAVMGLKELFSPEADRKRMFRALYISFGATLTVLFIGLLMSSGLSYTSPSDQTQFGSQWQLVRDAFVDARHHLFVSDSWRSILFVVLAAATVWVYIRFFNGKASSTKTAAITSFVLLLLVVVDLQGVDRRYLDSKSYLRSARQIEAHPDAYDYEIDRQAAFFGDTNYRVLNLAVNTFNDSKPSMFHNQVGGYSAAKLRRYQDLIDFYMSREIHPGVLSMLNTRYVVLHDGSVQRLPLAQGNCWLVDSAYCVASADDEILALDQLDIARYAVVDTSLFQIEATTFTADPADYIRQDYRQSDNMNILSYRSHLAHPRLALFSEIYYEPDWHLYIDGDRAQYIRANYVLRAALIPAGDHTLEFRNEAPRLHRLDHFTLIASLFTLIAVAAAIFFCYRCNRCDNKQEKQ